MGETQDEKLDKIWTDMYVGGGKDNPSMTVRMDRVERYFESQASWMKVVVLLLLGAIGTAVADIALRAH